jgi:hypothetical protein
MNSIMDNVRSDQNKYGFYLTQVDASNRSTTWTIMNSYFGTNSANGGVLDGGDTNTLLKCVFEGNLGTALYITNAEIMPSVLDCYFEFNSAGDSINIDSAYPGIIQNTRFADEATNTHINLSDSNGWILMNNYHSENINGGKINIHKSYASSGKDIIMGCTLPAATPISENAAGTVVIDPQGGILDRFKISTGTDITVNGAGNGLIVNNGTYNYRITVDSTGAVIATVI